MSVPLRYAVLDKIQERLMLAPKYGSNSATPYFVEVTRSELPQTARRPALRLVRDNWKTTQKGSVDGVEHEMLLYIGVYVAKQATVNETSLELEYAVATVEALMETDREIRKLTTSIAPIGGFDRTIAESYPTADAVLAYRVSYERERGKP